MMNNEPPWWFLFIVFGGPFLVTLYSVDVNYLNLRSAYAIGSISCFMVGWGVVGAYHYLWLGKTNHTSWLDPILLFSCLGGIVYSVITLGPLLVNVHAL